MSIKLSELKTKWYYRLYLVVALLIIAFSFIVPIFKTSCEYGFCTKLYKLNIDKWLGGSLLNMLISTFIILFLGFVISYIVWGGVKKDLQIFKGRAKRLVTILIPIITIFFCWFISTWIISSAYPYYPVLPRIDWFFYYTWVVWLIGLFFIIVSEILLFRKSNSKK